MGYSPNPPFIANLKKLLELWVGVVVRFLEPISLCLKTEIFTTKITLTPILKKVAFVLYENIET